MQYDDAPFETEGVSLTRQSFVDECDFNALMSRFEKTGVIEHIDARRPVYQDVSAFVEYQEAHNLVIAARSSFDALPSSVRERFGYDPSALISFLGDERNRDEAVKLGLIKASEAPPQEAGVAGLNQPPKEA